MIAISITRPRRELSIDVAELRSTLKNYQNTLYPRFSLIPKTVLSFPKTVVLFLLCIAWQVLFRQSHCMTVPFWNSVPLHDNPISRQSLCMTVLFRESLCKTVPFWDSPISWQSYFKTVPLHDNSISRHPIAWQSYSETVPSHDSPISRQPHCKSVLFRDSPLQDSPITKLSHFERTQVQYFSNDNLNFVKSSRFNRADKIGTFLIY